MDLGATTHIFNNGLFNKEVFDQNLQLSKYDLIDRFLHGFM